MRNDRKLRRVKRSQSKAIGGNNPRRITSILNRFSDGEILFYDDYTDQCFIAKPLSHILLVCDDRFQESHAKLIEMFPEFEAMVTKFLEKKKNK